MNIVGIDNSINSPGVVQFYLDDKTLRIEDKCFLGFTQKKKDTTGNIRYFKKKDFSDNIDQYLWMRDQICEWIFGDDEIDYVAFEDYAYAAIGKVFNIAESTGILKATLYEKDIPIRLYDPPSIKKYATGYGNADKVRMKQTYEKHPFRFPEKVNDDIIDAFFITRLLRKELSLRAGIDKLENLKEHERQVFIRCTKSYPENILVRPFLQRRSND